MFSANENLQLRQHKRRIVTAVEAAIPEAVLDAGTQVMVMQVACQDPGCVPIETAIIIVFPTSTVELMPGLPQSAGRSYKTKILKPMADVECPADVREALPPPFIGGIRTPQRLATQLRDAVFAQLQQLAPEQVDWRATMAMELQAALQRYVANDCVPPPPTQDYPNDNDTQEESATATNKNNYASIPTTGNYVMRRPAVEDDTDNNNASTTTTPAVSTTTTITTTTNTTTAPNATTTTTSSSSPSSSTNTSTRSSQSSSSSSSSHYDSISRRRQQAAATRNLLAQQSALTNSTTQHARGLRRVGCPCCDPDNPSNVVDQMMQL